jgi:hypothetical protein
MAANGRHNARTERRARRSEKLAGDRREKLREGDLEPLNPAVAQP